MLTSTVPDSFWVSLILRNCSYSLLSSSEALTLCASLCVRSSFFGLFDLSCMTVVIILGWEPKKTEASAFHRTLDNLIRKFSVHKDRPPEQSPEPRPSILWIRQLKSKWLIEPFKAQALAALSRLHCWTWDQQEKVYSDILSLLQFS